MKKGLMILIGILLFLGNTQLLQAQDIRKLSPFEGVSVIGNIEVILVAGDEEKASVEAFGVDEEDVSVYVKDDILRLQLVNSIFKRDEKARITVTYKKIRSLKANAGSHISNEGTIEGEKFYVKTTSGSDVELNLNVGALDASVMEGGLLTMNGTAESQEVSAATGGRYEGLGLTCKRSFARANTGGQVELVALESLDAGANTGGSIRYKGSPDERNTKTLLSGEVHRIQD